MTPILRLHRPLRAARRVSALAVVSLAATGTPAGAATGLHRATNVSSNWAGYAVTPRRAGQSFTRVAAQWIQPAVTCRTGQSSYSAFWIGLGGYHRGAQKLEQVGTDADCTRAGTPVQYAWYELVPAGPVNLRLRVSPGDTVSARVATSGTRVALTIADLTTGQSFSRMLRMSAPDTSSAEWITEAPSACNNSGNCRVLPLADFGAVAFSNASVTSTTRTGAISTGSWSTTRVELRDDSLAAFPSGFGARQLLADALPSGLLDTGRGFTVNWQSVSSSAPPGAPGSAGPPA